MWRWSPLLQRVQLGLISGAEAAAQPNLLAAPGPGPCGGSGLVSMSWYSRVTFLHTPCPVLPLCVQLGGGRREGMDGE